MPVSPARSVRGDEYFGCIVNQLRKELDNVPSGPSYQTGTMQFMAIEALQSKAILISTTWSMDLHSLWSRRCRRRGGSSCAAFKAEQEESETNGDKYISGLVYRGYRQIANTKRGHMVGFKNITAEFAPEFLYFKLVYLPFERNPRHAFDMREMFRHQLGH